jgi:hypothetical protein
MLDQEDLVWYNRLIEWANKEGTYRAFKVYYTQKQFHVTLIVIKAAKKISYSPPIEDSPSLSRLIEAALTKMQTLND